MKILISAQMQRIDRLTTDRYGVPSLTLMENAGRGVVEFLVQRYAPLGSHKIAVICGRGNNGGDGLVAARLLRAQGLSPRVVLLAEPTSLRGDAAINLARLTESGAPEIAANRETWQALAKDLKSTTLIVDAILGTGLSRPVDGFLAGVIRDLNESFPVARIIAVDLPSGVNADSGELGGDSVRADATVTFTAPKVAHVFSPAREQMGYWEVKSIGTPAEALENDAELFLNLIGPRGFPWLGQPRPLDAHKGDFGRVLIVAGSIGKTGAAGLAANAALRAGAGLVTVATAKSALPIIASLGMEFMTEPLPETEAGTIARRAWENGFMERLMEGKSVLALGPGLGTHSETAEFVRLVVNESKIPVVLDADGLNAFAGRMTDFRPASASVGSPPGIVFTPHPGEMARLTGLSTAEVQERRVEVARDFSTRYRITLALKGSRTLVASPDGQVAVNPTGNPGMATGGTGDILTGVMAGLLAQYPSRPVAEVVRAAVYLHGLAGDIAVEKWGEASMIAGDLLHSLSQAYCDIREGKAETPRGGENQV